MDTYELESWISFKSPNMNSKLICLVILVGITFVNAQPWVPVPRAVSYYASKHHHLLNVTKAHAGEEMVIFIGASSVENWSHNGKELWEEHYATRLCFNYGIGGDRTENVLWRIQQGELDGVKAKLVVVLVGSNNGNDKPEDIVKGLHAITEAIKSKIPQVKVLLLSILPRGNSAPSNAHVHATNKLLPKEEDKKSVFFLDMTVPFELSTNPGHINTSLYVQDQIHLTKEGYRVWYDTMEPLFSKLIV